MWISMDITFCDNTKCKKRSKCRRNMELLKNYPYPVSVSHFSPDKRGRCGEFLPLKSEWKPKTEEEKMDALFIQYLLEHEK